VTPSILVVDDSSNKRLAVQTMLAPLGHDVVEADSGRAALQAVMNQTFAVILMDVRMPIMDGYETARRIRRMGRSGLTPCIFITAFGSDAPEMASAYTSGAVDFIFTPVLPEVLRAKVQAFINLFLRTDELQRSLESITALNVALRESEERSQAVLDNVVDGIVTADDSGHIESLNRSAERLLGYTEQEAIGQPLELIVAPTHHGQLSAPVRLPWSGHAIDARPTEPTETVGRRKDESVFPMEVHLTRMQVGDRLSTICCVRDISERKAYTKTLEERALHDDLTGLANLTLFSDRMDHAIAAAGPSGRQLCVITVDLDGFAEVNATRGRIVGDGVLQAVAELLRGVMHGADTVGRIGGDRFAILPSGVTEMEEAAAIAWKLRAAFEQPFVVDGESVDGESVAVHPSIGIAFFPQHGRTTADLLRRADVAMREAKRTGSGLAVFQDDPADETARQLALLSELRHGIGNGELVLHYQPKVSLPGQVTTGVEALVRWQHPKHGLLFPDHFMPEAERSDLIEPLTRWVLNEALGQQSRWREVGLSLSMAVNISARSLTQGSDLPAIVAALTEQWGTVRGSLILEITESALAGTHAAVVLGELHDMGERLAIDDFGTGHSSLAYLQRLPIDEVKIDRSFVQNLGSAPGDAVIVRSTIDLAHNLGLTVVAEGVEDDKALLQLVDYGCDAIQGYLVSRPCPAPELQSWLNGSTFGDVTIEA
jgi:diguanylate cyclase (GGDEF)-like protein/PAS domain S-box-containing protein